MKTDATWSRSGWFPDQASRRSTMSGRPSSATCQAFFARDGVTLEEALRRPKAEDRSPLAQQMPDLLDRPSGGGRRR